MAPTPIAASHRLTFNYTSGTLTHKARILCELTASGDSTGFDVVARPGGTNQGVSAAADRFWNNIAPLYISGTDQFGTVVLEQFSGGAYIPLANYSTAVVPSGSGPAYQNTQLTFFFYGTGRGRVHLDLLGVNIPPAARWVSPSAAPSDVATVINNWILATHPDSPYVYAQTRGAQFVKSFVAATLSLNHKSRRRSGIA